MITFILLKNEKLIMNKVIAFISLILLPVFLLVSILILIDSGLPVFLFKKELD